MCIIYVVTGGPNDSIILMAPSFGANTFMISGVMSLHQVTLSDDNSRFTDRLDLSFHQLAGCGISVSDKGKWSVKAFSLVDFTIST